MATQLVAPLRSTLAHHDLDILKPEAAAPEQRAGPEAYGPRQEEREQEVVDEERERALGNGGRDQRPACTRRVEARGAAAVEQREEDRGVCLGARVAPVQDHGDDEDVEEEREDEDLPFDCSGLRVEV